MNLGLYPGVGGPLTEQLPGEILLSSQVLSGGDNVFSLPQVFIPQYNSYRVEILNLARVGGGTNVNLTGFLCVGGQTDLSSNYVLATPGGNNAPSSGAIFLAGDISNIEGTITFDLQNSNSSTAPHTGSFMSLMPAETSGSRWRISQSSWYHFTPAPVTGFTGILSSTASPGNLGVFKAGTRINVYAKTQQG